MADFRRFSQHTSEQAHSSPVFAKFHVLSWATAMMALVDISADVTGFFCGSDKANNERTGDEACVDCIRTHVEQTTTSQVTVESEISYPQGLLLELAAVTKNRGRMILDKLWEDGRNNSWGPPPPPRVVEGTYG